MDMKQLCLTQAVGCQPAKDLDRLSFKEPVRVPHATGPFPDEA